MQALNNSKLTNCYCRNRCVLSCLFVFRGILVSTFAQFFFICNCRQQSLACSLDKTCDSRAILDQFNSCVCKIPIVSLKRTCALKQYRYKSVFDFVTPSQSWRLCQGDSLKRTGTISSRKQQQHKNLECDAIYRWFEISTGRPSMLFRNRVYSI